MVLFTAKVVPLHSSSSSRAQSDYPGERTNITPFPGHRSSPNPVTMEARSDRSAHSVDLLSVDTEGQLHAKTLMVATEQNHNIRFAVKMPGLKFLLYLSCKLL